MSYPTWCCDVAVCSSYATKSLAVGFAPVFSMETTPHHKHYTEHKRKPLSKRFLFRFFGMGFRVYLSDVQMLVALLLEYVRTS